MTTSVVDVPHPGKRGRPKKSPPGIFPNNLVKTEAAKTREKDRATLWTAKVFGLLGNPRTGRGPVYWEDHHLPNRKPFLFIRKPSDLRPWERTGPMLRAAYLNLALASADDGTRAHAVTLRLGDNQIVKAMRARRGPLDHLRREIIRRLEITLGRSLDFWLGAETFASNGADLHLHGAIGLHPHEERAARNVLKQFGGYGLGTPKRGRVLDVRPEEGWEGGILPLIDDPRAYPGPAADAWEHYRRHLRTAWTWGSYSLKDGGRVADITGHSPLTESHALLDRARNFYEHHRQIMIDYIKAHG